MGASTEDLRIRTGSTGRGFASMDPERQREVSIDVIRFTEPKAAQRPGRAGRADWMRVQPDRDAGNYEGSSSRRGR
jgi:hypothetical protein